MDFIRYMITKYTLSPLEKDILMYLMKNIDDDGKLPIRDVSRDTFTSTTTIFNLAKKMGFSGYAELLYAIKSNMFTSHGTRQSSENASIEATTVDSDNIHIKTCRAFHAMLAKHKNDTIFTFGSGLSEIVSRYIHDKLLLEDMFVLRTTLLELLYSKQNENSLLIFVSESGSNMRVIELLEIANAIGLDSICFSIDANTKTMQLATLAIPLPTDMIDIHSRSLAPKIMLYFDDLLYKDTHNLLSYK